jgi:hypothetical protein
MEGRPNDWLAHRVGWLVVVALMAFAHFAQPGPLRRLDLFLYDTVEPLLRFFPVHAYL